MAAIAGPTQEKRGRIRKVARNLPVFLTGKTEAGAASQSEPADGTVARTAQKKLSRTRVRPS